MGWIILTAIALVLLDNARERSRRRWYRKFWFG
jgi:hypothetical protein